MQLPGLHRDDDLLRLFVRPAFVKEEPPIDALVRALSNLIGPRVDEREGPDLKLEWIGAGKLRSVVHAGRLPDHGRHCARSELIAQSLLDQADGEVCDI